MKTGHAVTRTLLIAGTLLLMASTQPPPRLRDGAPSADALISRFLDALERRDAAALRALRVSEREYLDVILPGSVEKDQPRRRWPEDVSRYFWSEIDSKSLYSEEALLQSWGGKHWTLKGLEYERGTKQYAAYTAHRQLRLTLAGEDGQEVVLATGSIAELGGQFKFLSYKRD
jgi:hypothetical protein